MARVSKFKVGQTVKSSQNTNFTYTVKKVNRNTLTVVPTEQGYSDCESTGQKSVFTVI